MTAVLANTRSNLVALTLATLASIALPMIGSAATAHTEIVAGAIPSVVVRYYDLNLATETGVQALYQRIVLAARLICGDPDNRDLSGMSAARSCRQEVVARAVQTINNPQLAALRAARGGRG